jgi:UDP-glucose 4-epimerase
MKILVTGGAGFIGSHICERLLKEGFEVICLDNFDPYYNPDVKWSNILPFQSDKNFTIRQGDIRDPAVLKEALNGVDYIFHEAAQAGVRISVEDPMKSHEVNATGTLNLLSAARDSGVKKVINASSSSVYGSVKYLPFDEDHPKCPVSPYGISKIMAEEYCRVFQELYGLPSVSLRYFTVYGPRMRPDLAISIFTKQTLRNKPLTIFGDGSKTRDFTYVEDIVNANILAMSKGSGAYNIGGGFRISIQELAETIIKITGSLSNICYANKIKGDAEDTFADTTKAEKEIGWKSQINFSEGLRRYVAWVLNCQSSPQRWPARYRHWLMD